MAIGTTRLSDLVVPEVWYPYFVQQSVKTSALLRSGILMMSEEYNRLAGNAGLKFDIPFLRPLVERSNEWRADGTNSTTAEKLVAGTTTTALRKRRHKLGMNDLAAHISGISTIVRMGKASWGFNASIEPGDMSGALAFMMTNLWNEDLQASLISVLKGSFASTTNVANVNDSNSPGLAELNLNVAVTTGTITSANKVSPVTLGRAASLLGDFGGMLSTLIVHSDVYFANLQPSNITPQQQTNSQTWAFNKYLDYNLIFDDQLPVDRTNPLYPVYTSYLIAPGAIAFGEAELAPGLGAEITRDGDQAEDFLHTRKAYFMQPQGVSYAGTVPAHGAGPSDATMELGATWARSNFIKNIGMVQIKTNG
jgi:hypothetical protein